MVNGSFHATVRRISISPAAQLSFQGAQVFFDQFHVSNRFAREDGSVVFAATLSNELTGVFEADGETLRTILVAGETPEGAASPARLLYAPLAAGSWTAFLAQPELGGRWLVLDDGAGPRLIAASGDSLAGVLIEGIGVFDLNAAGMVAFQVHYLSSPGRTDSELLLYQGGQISVLTRPRPLPGLLDAELVSFSGPFVSDFGEVFFGASQRFGLGAIFCWRAGRLTKIAADGDPAPGGRTMQVSVVSEITLLPPPIGPTQRITRPHRAGELAFQVQMLDDFSRQAVSRSRMSNSQARRRFPRRCFT